MNGYRSFMDRQTLSVEAHRRLLELDTQKKSRKKGATMMTYTSLAACAALIIGVGLHALLPGGSGPVADRTTAPPTQQGDVGQMTLVGDRAGFVAQGPAEGGKMPYPAARTVEYTDCGYQPIFSQPMQRWKAPDGSFCVPLSPADILTVFWGPAGKPAVENPKVDPGDFPLHLMGWAGYTVSGQADYDGQGDLWRVTIQGEKEDSSFTLILSPEPGPASCQVSSEWVVTDVLGTAVTGWRWSDDADGDGVTEHNVWSRFSAGGVDVAFGNVNSGGSRASEVDGGEATDLGGAVEFNRQLVTQFCQAGGAPYLGHIAHNDHIPDWRYEQYDTLEAAARGSRRFSEAFPGAKGFEKYLPQSGPAGFGEFAGSLDYQAGTRSGLHLRWSVVGGYDDVVIDVRLPEGDSTAYYVDALVDVSVPASYDWRLYDGAICDVVPEAYQMNFYEPTFRSEDMSLEVVEARGHGKDTGGMAYRFSVLHEDGTVVSYDCSGVDARYVWSLVAATL